MNITTKQLEERYKVIEINKVSDDIEVVDLWKEKGNVDYHVRLMFAFNKLFTSGDCGSFTFGGTICHIYSFFKGDNVNLGYWQEKVEASPRPLLCEDIDIEKANAEIRKFYEEYVDLSELSEEEKEEFEDDLFFLTGGPFPQLDTNMYRAWDAIKTFLKEHYADGYDYSYISDIIDECRDWDGQFEYTCNVIQWVENNLDEWRTKYGKTF